MGTEPLYQSNCTARNLWQKYEIFPDHLELHTHLGNLRIPFDQIEAADVVPPVLQSIRLHLRRCLPVGVKLDCADFSEHVLLDKKSGIIRHVLFTPENPTEFRKVLQMALKKFRQGSGKESAGP